MDVFLSVVGLLVLLVCFWLCMASFSVCSLLACLSFCFVSCPYIRSYRFPGMLRIRSGARHAKSAAALRCRSFPGSIRRHRSDIDTIVVWHEAGRYEGIGWAAQARIRYRTVAWKTIHSPKRIEFGPFDPEPAWPSALLLSRYRVQIIRNGPSPTSDLEGRIFPISEPQGTCHTDGPSDPALGL